MPKQDNYAGRRQYALQGLEKLVTQHDKFFIDTCSIMSAYMPLFAENIIPLLIKHNKKLSVCSSVIRELKKLSHPIGTSISGELYAYMGLCVLDRFIDNNLLEYVEDNVYSGPADLAFQQVFLALRREHRLLLITQDGDLTNFVLNYNNNASVWGKPIEIKYINSYGFLSSRADAVPAKPQSVAAPAKNRPNNKQQNSFYTKQNPAQNNKKATPQQQKSDSEPPKKPSVGTPPKPFAQPVAEHIEKQTIAMPTAQPAAEHIEKQTITMPTAQPTAEHIEKQTIAQPVEETSVEKAVSQQTDDASETDPFFTDLLQNCMDDIDDIKEDDTQLEFSPLAPDCFEFDLLDTLSDPSDTESQTDPFDTERFEHAAQTDAMPVTEATPFERAAQTDAIPVTEATPQKKSPLSYSFTEKDAQSHITDNKLYVPTGYTSVGFTNAPNITTAYLPDTVKNINSQAFRDCRRLSRIVLPSTLETIGQSAFLNCSSLLSITIPSGVCTISNGVFKNCTRLRLINLNPSITSIGSGAFAGCTSLSIITIPKSVTYIAKNAFSGCKSLIIQCYENSFAHCFAYENNIPFELIG